MRVLGTSIWVGLVAAVVCAQTVGIGYAKDLNLPPEPPEPELASPWVLFQNEMIASIGRSTCVKVDLLDGSGTEFTLKVHVLEVPKVCEDKLQGVALSSLLTRD